MPPHYADPPISERLDSLSSRCLPQHRRCLGIPPAGVESLHLRSSPPAARSLGGPLARPQQLPLGSRSPYDPQQRRARRCRIAAPPCGPGVAPHRRRRLIAGAGASRASPEVTRVASPGRVSRAVPHRAAARGLEGPLARPRPDGCRHHAVDIAQADLKTAPHPRAVLRQRAGPLPTLFMAPPPGVGGPSAP